MIYCSHVFEYFNNNEIESVLQEWCRCLKLGGFFSVSMPVFSALTKINAMDQSLDKILHSLLGGQYYKTDFHYSACEFRVLKSLLRKVGLETIHKWNPRRTYHS